MLDEQQGEFSSEGRTTAETGSVPNPFQFTGRERNAGTSLYYVRARTYDPDTGRFLFTDCLGSAGTSAYAYAGATSMSFPRAARLWLGTGTH